MWRHGTLGELRELRLSSVWFGKVVLGQLVDWGGAKLHYNATTRGMQQQPGI